MSIVKAVAVVGGEAIGGGVPVSIDNASKNYVVVFAGYVSDDIYIPFSR